MVEARQKFGWYQMHLLSNPSTALEYSLSNLQHVILCFYSSMPYLLSEYCNSTCLWQLKQLNETVYEQCLAHCLNILDTLPISILLIYSHFINLHLCFRDTSSVGLHALVNTSGTLQGIRNCKDERQSEIYGEPTVQMERPGGET